MKLNIVRVSKLCGLIDHTQEIMAEFYDARLAAYGRRKRAMLASMEHELRRISNQARFILMVIADELKIANRRRADIVAELRERKFEAWAPRKNSANTLRNRAKATDADDESEGEGVESVEGTGDYAYLLSMKLSALTKEQVEQLLARQEDALAQVHALQKQSSKDLWRADLDALEECLDEYRTEYEDSVAKMRQEAEAKRKQATQGAKAKTTGRRGTKRKAATKKSARSVKPRVRKKAVSKASRKSRKFL